MEMSNSYNVDFMFKFQFPDTDSHMGLWAHQSVLLSMGTFMSIYILPGLINTTSSTHWYYLMEIQIPEFSLVAHCGMLRFIYTDQVPEQINLQEYVITPFPAMPHFLIDVMLLKSFPVQPMPWGDLLHLADKYQLDSLSIICQQQVVAGLTFQTAVLTLLEFGAKFPGLQVHVIKFCADQVLELYKLFCKPLVTEVEIMLVNSIVAVMLLQVADRTWMMEVCKADGLEIVCECGTYQHGGEGCLKHGIRNLIMGGTVHQGCLVVFMNIVSALS